jgi:hypothetical protein
MCGAAMTISSKKIDLGAMKVMYSWVAVQNNVVGVCEECHVGEDTMWEGDEKQLRWWFKFEALGLWLVGSTGIL